MDAPEKRNPPDGAGSERADHWRGLQSQDTPKRLPPFGKKVEAALAAGRHPNVRLFACANAWDLARTHRQAIGDDSALVLPPGDDPDAYRWPRVLNLVGNITGLPSEQIPRLARALVRDGCLLAYLLDAAHPERNMRVVAKRSAA